ncbi:MarC family protein [Pseudonocardia sp. H11422]|uniref:MarC family protein n=1 Tax=Pseudonocardia sp. H11422 TaxID=2835866 RepID=UPI0027E3483B|nr:MarC family protein [Pseudonocardia sp. H11422]
MTSLKFFISVFVTLFIIMDPIGTIPIFLALTGGRGHQERKRLAAQAVLVSFSVIAVFALFGQSILNYLGITLAAMQGAGGLLLLLVALELLTGHEQTPSQAGNVNVALVPLGTPLLAGPGAIVATMVFVRQVHSVTDAVALAGGVIAVHLSLWLTMRYSVGLLHLLRDGGITLITRISGLLLSAIAVQLVADSVTAFVETA